MVDESLHDSPGGLLTGLVPSRHLPAIPNRLFPELPRRSGDGKPSVLCQKSVNMTRCLGVGWLGPGLSGVMGGLNRLSNKGVLLRVR